MSKNQNKSFYFILTILYLLIGAFQTYGAKAPDGQLTMADSLFQEKKYTESFEIYDKIITDGNQASPRMLLKMSFIKEGLGDYSNALYYLNLYYLKTSDKKARTKMQEIAKEHQLVGFEINDGDFFLGLLRQYYLPINILIFLLAAGLLTLMVIRKIKHQTKLTSPWVSLLFVLGLLYYSINYTTQSNQGIIIQNHSYIMSGPSAGANLIEVIDKGHRVKIYSTKGPWVEVDWNGRRAFVRDSKIRKVG